MDRKEAIEVLKKNYPDICYTMLREAVDMAIEALKTQDVVEELTQDLADRLNDAYAAGYSAAKREIALSGEYERAYQRGKADATKWIQCSERLPENANHLGALCPRYQVSTKFGVTEGWYNPDKGCWYVLVWFLNEGEWNSKNISMNRGDIPKVVKGIVVDAWKPLPKPYNAESEGEDDRN